jgi:tetratricopeptide (TPR) repeat protein
LSALALFVFATTAFAEECLVGTRLLNFDETMASCTELIRRDPTNAEAYEERGHLYAMKASISRNIDDHNSAIADYTRAISITQNVALLYYARGLEYEAINDFGRAIADLRRMLELLPNSSIAIEALRRLNARP